MRYFLISLTALLFSLAVQAQVYVWTNEDGVRVYGDEPPADSKKADLPQIQPLKHIKDPDAEKKKNKEKQEKASGEFTNYTLVEIVSPEEDYMLTSGAAGTLTVRIALKPELQPGHSVTLLLDGQPVPSTGGTNKVQQSLQFELNNLERGSHLLQAFIKHRGKLYASSAKRRFYVKRPSILNKAR